MKLWRYGQEIELLGQKRYRLVGSLGSGGMADVCLAIDEREKREVAIKIIKQDKLDQTTLDRFLKETAQIQRLNHPHILAVYSGLNLELLDVARGSIVPYIVMEYAQGGDLYSRLTRGQPYPFDKTLQIFSQLCSAVQYAHDRGVIHRDLKPHNILIRKLPDGSEQIALADFGMAVEIDATHHTYAGGGTPLYMSPEQFRGRAEAASDIFALGVILYQLITGHFPFSSVSPFQNAISYKMPAAPSTVNPNLPKALDDVVLKALAKEPSQRFASASLFEKSVHATTAPSTTQQFSRPLDKREAPATKVFTHSTLVTPSTIQPTPAILPNTPKHEHSQLKNGKRTPSEVKQATYVSPTSSRYTGRYERPPLVNFTRSRAKVRSVDRGSVPFQKKNTQKLVNPTSTVVLAFMLIFVVVIVSLDVLKVPAISAKVENMIPKTVKHVPASAAKGTITFYNSLPNAVTVGVTVFTIGNRVKFENDANVVVPAANAPSEGIITVNAHALTLGSRGNIGARAFNGACCTTGITAINGAFNGGEDAYDALSPDDSVVTVSLRPSFSLVVLRGRDEMMPTNPSIK